jgi:hypothetical protein
MFERAYQSSKYSQTDSDHSQSGSGSEKEKSGGNESPNEQPQRRRIYKKTKKDALWTTRPPNFRSQRVCGTIHIDVLFSNIVRYENILTT